MNCRDAQRTAQRTGNIKILICWANYLLSVYVPSGGGVFVRRPRWEFIVDPSRFLWNVHRIACALASETRWIGSERIGKQFPVHGHHAFPIKHCLLSKLALVYFGRGRVHAIFDALFCRPPVAALTNNVLIASFSVFRPIAGHFRTNAFCVYLHFAFCSLESMNMQWSFGCVRTLSAA